MNQGLVVVSGSVVPTKITALKTIASPVLIERNNALDHDGHGRHRRARARAT